MNLSSGSCNGSDEPRAVTPSIDDTLKILEDPLRRDIIECCATTSGKFHDVETVADSIIDAREDTVERDELLLEFHHKHLPLLDEHGVIDFDPRGGQFRYHPDEFVEQWLRRVQEEARD